jgi:hypothetical protein
MLRRSIAALLLILVASPFTAPFETCDLAALFGSPITFGPLHVQFAWTFNEDCHAIAPRVSASQRVRMSMGQTPQTAPASTVAPPSDHTPMPLMSLSSESGSPSSPASRSPLRI